MRDDHALVMQVKLCKANTRGVTSDVTRSLFCTLVPAQNATGTIVTWTNAYFSSSEFYK